MRLLVVSDTHVPQRAKTVPAELWSEAESCDVLIHAGDWNSERLLDEFAALVPVIGVYGNNDGPDLQRRLPEVARVELEGVRLAVVHDSGPAAGREERCASTYPDVDVLIFGHSHIPWDTTAPNGLRLLNPGSPTDRRRQPSCTYLTAEISTGVLHEVELHRLTSCR